MADPDRDVFPEKQPNLGNRALDRPADDVSQTMVSLCFRRGDGELVPCAVQSSPLGILFHRRLPLQVHKVIPNSPAALAGVQPGWILVAVNGKELKVDSFEAACRAIMRVAASLTPLAPALPSLLAADDHVQKEDRSAVVNLGFRQPSGSLVPCTVQSAPLGIEHRKGTPLQVAKVLPYSPAEAAGVQEEWELVSINGRSLESGSYEQAVWALKEVSATLPLRPFAESSSSP